MFHAFAQTATRIDIKGKRRRSEHQIEIEEGRIGIVVVRQAPCRGDRAGCCPDAAAAAAKGDDLATARRAKVGGAPGALPACTRHRSRQRNVAERPIDMIEGPGGEKFPKTFDLDGAADGNYRQAATAVLDQGFDIAGGIAATADVVKDQARLFPAPHHLQRDIEPAFGEHEFAQPRSLEGCGNDLAAILVAKETQDRADFLP